MAGPPVQVQCGENPPPWRGEVLYFANILSLFFGNQAQTDDLRREVGALESYGCRLVPLIPLLFEGRQHTLVLEQAPVPALLSYFKKSLGLRLPIIDVLRHEDYRKGFSSQPNSPAWARERMARWQSLPGDWVDGYVTDEILVDVARQLGRRTLSSPEGSRRGNNKRLLHEFLKSLGFPVFDTVMASNREEIVQALRGLAHQGYHRAVVKSAIGASGIGMFRLETSETSAAQIPDSVFYEGSCCVQGWLDESLDGVRFLGSPSVQIMVRDEVVILHDITEQILSRASIHEGNIAPPLHFLLDEEIRQAILEQAGAAGQWLCQQGYRSTASADFHVIDRRGRREVRLCELNARVTGATYPSFLAHHFFPGGAWLMRNLRFHPPVSAEDILDKLHRARCLFEKGKRVGVLPFNLNPDSKGKIVKGQFLFCSPTSREAADMLSRLNDHKDWRGTYDRD